MLHLQQEIDRLFDLVHWNMPMRGLFPERQGLLAADGELGELVPDFDITVTDGAYEMAVELPGLEIEDIDVTLADGVLTIRGEKQIDKTDDVKNYYRRERRFGSFTQSLRLPESVDEDKIQARLDKGILTITLPKTVEALKREKKIDVKAA